mgnify:FL=1
MLYIYDKNNLVHRRIGILKVTAGILVASGLISATAYYTGVTHGFENLTEVEKAIVIKKTDEFEKEKLVEMLKDL